MKPYYQDDLSTIYCGDCRKILPELDPVDVVITDPPYFGLSEGEFEPSGEIAVALHMASERARTMIVFGNSSGAGIRFVCSSIHLLPHRRTLTWQHIEPGWPDNHGPWCWDSTLVHVFGVERDSGVHPTASVVWTSGALRIPIPPSVIGHFYEPFAPKTVLDPFMGSGTTLQAVRSFGARSIGIEISKERCQQAVEVLSGHHTLSAPEGTPS